MKKYVIYSYQWDIIIKYSKNKQNWLTIDVLLSWNNIFNPMPHGYIFDEVDAQLFI